jgi:hypothetical protein
LLGAALAALKRGERVIFFTDVMREQQLRGRLMVLESRVNGYRFRAGLASDEDRMALGAARDRIPWSLLTVVAHPQIGLAQLQRHIVTYSPQLAVADVWGRAPAGGGRAHTSWLFGALEQLGPVMASGAALLMRTVLPRGSTPPSRLELPGMGAMAELFAAALLLHREEVTDPGVADEALGLAEAYVVRVGGHDIEPRPVTLRFDQRFAGLLEV